MRKLELTGKRFGRWTVLKEVEKSPRGNSRWLCRCDCGTEAVVEGQSLNYGGSKSCGCYAREQTSKAKTVHGGAKVNGKESLYIIWKHVRRRCLHKNDPAYKWYGQRGISMCQEWKDDYNAFREWASVNGYEKGLSIERIDVNGNYCPDNCKWITRAEQSRNRRCSIRPGDVYGALTVISHYKGDLSYARKYLCKCVCGKEIVVWTTILTAYKDDNFCRCDRRRRLD